jgi:predicted Zn-ribbon and HTH transcriptional regulator
MQINLKIEVDKKDVVKKYNFLKRIFSFLGWKVIESKMEIYCDACGRHFKIEPENKKHQCPKCWYENNRHGVKYFNEMLIIYP